MRVPYYCPYCDQRSTRRWNLEIHIKRRHGGYLPDSSSDRYMANNPPLYSKSVQLGHATVADTSFQSRYLPQQAPLGTSQYYTSPIYRSTPSMDDQSYGSGLSQDTIVKIGEFKRLVYKYPQYHNNDPDEIVKWAIYCSSNGDDTFLDDKLEQLRSIFWCLVILFHIIQKRILSHLLRILVVVTHIISFSNCECMCCALEYCRPAHIKVIEVNSWSKQCHSETWTKFRYLFSSTLNKNQCLEC
jgi:hypothetical protein